MREFDFTLPRSKLWNIGIWFHQFSGSPPVYIPSLLFCILLRSLRHLCGPSLNFKKRVLVLYEQFLRPSQQCVVLTNRCRFFFGLYIWDPTHALRYIAVNSFDRESRFIPVSVEKRIESNQTKELEPFEFTHECYYCDH